MITNHSRAEAEAGHSTLPQSRECDTYDKSPDMTHIRESRPGSGLELKVKSLEWFEVVLSSLGNGAVRTWH